MTRSRAILRFALIAAAMGVLSACTRPAGPPAGQRDAAEAGPATGEGSNAGISLLRIDRVQKDLQLTDEQRVQILSLTMEMRENRVNVGNRLTDILKPEQRQRFKEIRLQVEGPAGVNSPETAKALELTKEQRAQLKTLQDQVRNKVHEVSERYKSLTTEEWAAKRAEVQEELQRTRVETTEKALEVLTPAQRKKFERMQGVKLHLDVPAQPPQGTSPELPPQGEKTGS